MKKLIALFLTILLCASITPFALAAESPEKSTQMEVSSESLIETSEFNALTPPGDHGLNYCILNTSRSRNCDLCG